MTDTFIHPNWHVILIHYPIGFLTTGVIFELISLIWYRERFRAAGRWMILIGALSSVVTLTSGIYAFRDVVSTVPAEPDYKWHYVVDHTVLSSQQWTLMSRHIWYTSFAVFCFLLVIALWLSGREERRRRFYVPLLILLLIGVGLMAVGGWYGGESVFRYGTAVNYNVIRTEKPVEYVSTEIPSGVAYYIPPLQLHIVMAGAVIALMVAASGLYLRRWERATDMQEARSGSTGTNPPFGPGTGSITEATTGRPTIPVPEPSTAVSPAMLWLVGVLAALGTAVAGVWAVVGKFSSAALSNNWNTLDQPEHRRLLMHVITGGLLILLAITLSIVTKFFRSQYKLASILIIIVMVVAALQVYSGILILYDSPEGSMIRFSAKSEGAQILRHAEPPAPPARSTAPAQPPATLPSAPGQ